MNEYPRGTFDHYRTYGPLGVACALVAMWECLGVDYKRPETTRAELYASMKHKLKGEGLEWLFSEESNT